ncbi:MAG: hypothetical protein Q9217_004576 [Psora testacea]
MPLLSHALPENTIAFAIILWALCYIRSSVPDGTHICEIREEHKWERPLPFELEQYKQKLHRYLLPDGWNKDQEPYCLDKAMDMMITAIAQWDREIATVKEALNIECGDPSPVLHALSEVEHHPQQDMGAVATRFRQTFLNSSLYNSIDPALRATWETLNDRKLIMLVKYTLWHSGPALAWKRTDK